MRIRVLAVFLAAALLQPLLALAGEGGLADAAFPLWTQNAEGQFIVMDVDTGKYQLAPHQVPQGESAPYSFTYDPSRDLLWMLVSSNGSTILAYLNPHTGVYGQQATFPSETTWLSSLTYRRRDGALYGLEVVLPPQGYPPTEAYVVSFDSPGATRTRVVQIQPKTVYWSPGVGENPNGEYHVSNTPPLTLCFDPMTDVAYVTASPDAEGWLFSLDMQTGETTVVRGELGQRVVAQTFAPMTQDLYTLIVNEGPSAILLYYNLVPGHVGTVGPLGYVPTPYTLAFVPKVTEE